jgi:hypothetical protein
MSNWGNHLVLLEEEHQRLDKRIDGLESTGVYDDDQLNELKKQRLNLRDQIAKLKAQHNI